MHQREAQDEIRRAAIGQRPAFPSPPAQAGRGVGDVRHEWQDGCVALSLERVIQAVDDDVVGVQRQDVFGVFGRHPGVDTGVATDVPHQRPALGRQHLSHDRRFACQVGVLVAVFPLIVRPGRARRVPVQPLDRPAQPGKVVLDERGAETGGAQLALDVPVRGFVAGLHLPLQVYMGQHAGPEIVARGQARPALVGSHAIEPPTQPGVERDVPIGLKQERIEEHFAELAVAGPGVSRFVCREGADVDERRA